MRLSSRARQFLECRGALDGRVGPRQVQSGLSLLIDHRGIRACIQEEGEQGRVCPGIPRREHEGRIAEEIPVVDIRSRFEEWHFVTAALGLVRAAYIRGVSPGESRPPIHAPAARSTRITCGILVLCRGRHEGSDSQLVASHDVRALLYRGEHAPADPGRHELEEAALGAGARALRRTKTLRSRLPASFTVSETPRPQRGSARAHSPAAHRGNRAAVLPRSSHEHQEPRGLLGAQVTRRSHPRHLQLRRLRADVRVQAAAGGEEHSIGRLAAAVRLLPVGLSLLVGLFQIGARIALVACPDEEASYFTAEGRGMEVAVACRSPARAGSTRPPCRPSSTRLPWAFRGKNRAPDARHEQGIDPADDDGPEDKARDRCSHVFHGHPPLMQDRCTWTSRSIALMPMNGAMIPPTP